MSPPFLNLRKVLLQLFTNDFIPPFVRKCKKNKSRAIKSRGDKGVYLIKENSEIVYVGMSQSCVTEALYRHFYRYNDTHRKPRTYYNPDNGNNYMVYILYTSKDDAPKLERGLVLGIVPRDNRDRFQKYLDDLSVRNIEKNISEVVDYGAVDDLPF